MIQIKSQTIHH